LAEPQPIARAHRAREQADERDLLAGRTALDLEDAARHGTVDVASRRRQQLGDTGHQGLDARSRERGAEEHRMQQRSFRLRDELVVGCAVGREGHGPRPDLAHRSHRDDRRSQPVRDALQHAFRVRTGTVDLVHEQKGRNAEPLQRPHQQRGLRLDALDGGDHEHRAVEHAQHALDLGDEVRVAGRVDQVDGDVVDRERHDRRADRDAALLLERQRVGLRRAGVDAADLVDDAGRVQQPLGERRLTGVYMRQDP